MDFWGDVTIEKMFDIHDNDNVVICTSPADSKKPPEQAEENDVKHAQRGPRKQSLFTSNKPNEENKPQFGIRGFAKEKYKVFK